MIKKNKALKVKIGIIIGMCVRLASLVGITERETGVGKLGWHGNSTVFDRKEFDRKKKG